MDNIFPVYRSINCLSYLLNNLSLDVYLFLNNSIDLLLSYSFYDLRSLYIFSLNLINWLSYNFFYVDRLLNFLFNKLFNNFNFINIFIDYLFNRNLHCSLDYVVYVSFSLYWILYHLFNHSFKSIFYYSLYWYVDQFLYYVSMTFSNLFDHILLQNVHFSWKNLICILELSQIFFINLINLVYIDRIFYKSLNSFLNNLLNWNLSYFLYIDRLLYESLYRNFNYFLDRNFYYFLYRSFFMNFCDNISICYLLYRSFYYNVYWDIHFPIHRDRPLYHDLNLFVHKPFIDDRLLRCYIDIHIALHL